MACTPTPKWLGSVEMDGKRWAINSWGSSLYPAEMRWAMGLVGGDLSREEVVIRTVERPIEVFPGRIPYEPAYSRWVGTVDVGRVRWWIAEWTWSDLPESRTRHVLELVGPGNSATIVHSPMTMILNGIVFAPGSRVARFPENSGNL